MTTFKQAIVLGRMQHIHKGHEKIIDMALEASEKVVILVGSAQKGGPDSAEERNPFDAEFRMFLIEQIYAAYGDRVTVIPIADVSGETDIELGWAQHIIGTLDQYADGGFAGVDLMVYGNDENRMEWFNFPETWQQMKQLNHLIVAHENDRISATKIRKFIEDDEFAKWSECVNPALFNHYPEIRARMLGTKAYEGRG